MLVSENTIQKKQQEIEQLKTKIEKRLAEDEKHLIRDRATFEKHFGNKPRATEEKYVSFLRMYEQQRDKMDRQMDALEKEIDRLNQAN